MKNKILSNWEDTHNVDILSNQENMYNNCGYNPVICNSSQKGKRFIMEKEIFGIRLKPKKVADMDWHEHVWSKR